MIARVSTATAVPGRALVTKVALNILAVVIVVAGGFTVWYRQTYNVWPGQGASARVHWCGRDYQTGGGALTWKQISSRERFSIRAVGQYPPLGWSRQELLAAVTPEAQRFAASPPLPCAMAVYIRTDRNRYRAYGLLGGP